MPDLELLGPEDTGSMAAKLARMEADAQPDSEVSPEPKPEPEPEPKPAGDEEAPLPEETKPPEGEPPPEEVIPEGWKFAPKYKDHQTAEEGAREHQQKVTAATEETKREREAREKLEQENEELKTKLAEQEAAAAKPPEPPAKTPEEVEAEAETRIEAALVEIGGLDETAPDYQKKVAQAWRKAGVGGAGQPVIPDPKEIARLAVAEVRETLRADQEAAGKKEIEKRQKDEADQTWDKAVKMAQEAGLDMNTDSAEYDLFSLAAGRLPAELKEEGIPLKAQVDWAVGEVRRRLGRAVQMTAAEKEKARRAQEANAVLERGNNRPAAPAAAPRLRSMDEILTNIAAKGQR